MEAISAADLQALLLAQEEVAVLDPREEGAYSLQPHLFHAVNLPLSSLELRAAALLPNRQTRIVIASDAEDGLAERMSVRLAVLGYQRVQVLSGGCQAFAALGLPLFTGFNTASKAFGEFVERGCHTPSLGPHDLQERLRRGDNLVIVDSRTPDEHHLGTIPGSRSVPGAELVLRASDFAPDPATIIVVNCAGRTRSIIGAQSLINAAVPNPVMALRDGTMGWRLAGYQIETHSIRCAQDLSSQARAKSGAKAAAMRARYRIARIDWATCKAWMSDVAGPICYLFDVRMPQEYLAAHPRHAVHAPGGQLIQATDTYVAARGARIVLYDDLGVRAAMTAAWLRQMGYAHVYVLNEDDGAIPLDAGPVPRKVLGLEPAPALAAAEVHALGTAAEFIDLAPSRDYTAGHVAGAWWAVRSRLAACLSKVPSSAVTVLTSADGVLAQLAWREVAALRPGQVVVLAGGTHAWRRQGLPLDSGEQRMTCIVDDAFVKPFEAKDVQASMRSYLEWEVNLLGAVQLDPSIRFSLATA